MKKLKLNKETIANLQSEELKQLKGGGGAKTYSPACNIRTRTCPKTILCID